MKNKPETTPALLLCPFCGGEADYSESVNGTQMAYCGCSSCGIYFKAAWFTNHDLTRSTSKDIKSAWNTRTPPQPASCERGGGLSDEEMAKILRDEIHVYSQNIPYGFDDAIKALRAAGAFTPMPDKGATKSWCSDSCYKLEKAREIIGKMREALVFYADNGGSIAFNAVELADEWLKS